MKKIVSIALFGDENKYGNGLRAFVLAHLNLFPLDEGWMLRVHLSDSVYAGRRGQFLRRMAALGLLEVRAMGEAPLTKAMLWRMAPVFDKNVDYVFCRDLDCCPMPRDRAVCEQFIKSECIISAVHDAPAHSGVMGGLSGYWAPRFREHFKLYSLETLTDTARPTDDYAKHGTDQDVLNRLICREGGPTLLEHRYAGWSGAEPNVNPAREAGEYLCPAWSTPTPNVGISKFSAEQEADRLANHLGAAGFDVERAERFYEEHGDLAITRMVLECESECGEAAS